MTEQQRTAKKLAQRNNPNHHHDRTRRCQAVPVHQ